MAKKKKHLKEVGKMDKVTKHRCGYQKICKIFSLTPNSRLIDFNINCLNILIKMQRDFDDRNLESNSTMFLRQLVTKAPEVI